MLLLYVKAVGILDYKIQLEHYRQNSEMNCCGVDSHTHGVWLSTSLLTYVPDQFYLMEEKEKNGSFK